MKSIIFRILALHIALNMILAACAPNIVESNKSREKNPQIAEGDLQDLVDGNNAFALDLYNALRPDESGNLILSPYSISLALAMTYAGARGETESQMAQVMHYLPQSQLHTAFNSLDIALKKKPENLKWGQKPLHLNIANSIWLEKTLPVLPEYLDTIAINYGAGVRLADFQNNPEQSRTAINNWISDETNNQIKDALPKDTISLDTLMIVANTIYFKADWQNKFDADRTSDAPFHLLDGTEITTKMMGTKIESPVLHLQGSGYQAIELPYAGETTAMDIILPDEGNFETFEDAFNQDTYIEIINGMQPASSATVELPKFKFDNQLNMSAALEDLGMTNAFGKNAADFSGITGGKNLYINKILQNAFVIVDEKGTEAGASSIVLMFAGGARMPEVSFIADRPFLFIIRDTVNGQILFVGRVLNPNEK